MFVYVYCMYFKSTKALSIEKLSLFYGSKSEMTCPIVVEFEFLFYFLPEDHAIGLSTFTVMAGLGGNYLFYFTNKTYLLDNNKGFNNDEK